MSFFLPFFFPHFGLSCQRENNAKNIGLVLDAGGYVKKVIGLSRNRCASVAGKSISASACSISY